MGLSLNILAQHLIKVCMVIFALFLELIQAAGAQVQFISGCEGHFWKKSVPIGLTGRWFPQIVDYKGQWDSISNIYITKIVVLVSEPCSEVIKYQYSDGYHFVNSISTKTTALTSQCVCQWTKVTL